MVDNTPRRALAEPDPDRTRLLVGAATLVALATAASAITIHHAAPRSDAIPARSTSHPVVTSTPRPVDWAPAMQRHVTAPTTQAHAGAARG